ncbi:MAG TPA: carbonic anhydrase [Gammaproteobacteria bacterium]|nr:carbonic anhydrase [Gammaproteobacteria bacterium]MDP6732384.1 carbonic anhydrase [Gammaproteobacteria bacterium]HAJ77205.1 carbonic anhydrase [Gammaproteobacteria bacterium]
MISADAALLRLKEGNQRFRTGDMAVMRTNANGPPESVQPQAPFAIVLGCSDSRVPTELIFGQGLGDLFVIRVVGNVVAPSQIGSVEFAAEKFGTRLVVVLGHSMCGAVQATLDQLKQHTDKRSPHLRAIVDRIRPGIEPLLKSAEEMTEDELLESAVRANIDAAVDKLCSGSEIIESLVQQQGFRVIGAKYHLESGKVEFF